MGKRREARERAVQFLFQHDLNPPENLDRELNEFWDTQRAAAIAGEKGPATTSTGTVFAFIDAPEGYEIELIQKSKGSY